MFFLRTQQPPVQIQWGEKVLIVPKFLLDDAIEWSQQIQSSIASMATESMEEEQRRQYLMFYPVMPADLQELKRNLVTPAGVKRVIETCLARAVVVDKKANVSDGKLSPSDIAGIIANNGMFDLQRLATELADFTPPLPQAPQTPQAGDGEVPPLPISSKRESPPSQGTGISKSQSSTPHTPASIPATSR